MFRTERLASATPALVADILKNPRLKTARDLYGSPGDDRYALLDSHAWTWTKESRPNVAGHRLTPGAKTGQRLLGIRVDNLADTGMTSVITVTLVNAGGSDNGAVAGEGTLRYAARHSNKGWQVELE